MRFIPSLLFVAAFVASACTTSSEEDKLMQEAFNIHQEAMQVANETRALLTATDQTIKDLQSIRNRLERWEDDLVEVPGFEHEHDHSHDHDHGHDHSHDHDHGHDHGHSHSHSTLDLLPADMLAIQQEFLDSIKAIRSDLLPYQQGL